MKFFSLEMSDMNAGLFEAARSGNTANYKREMQKFQRNLQKLSKEDQAFAVECVNMVLDDIRNGR